MMKKGSGLEMVRTNAQVKLVSSSEVVDTLLVVLFFLFPEGEVLLEEFNDALGVTEVFFFELIDLIKGFLQSFISEITCRLVIFHDFVMEDREVKGKTELDWVARLHSNTVGFIVSFKGFLFDFLKLSILGILSDVTVVVTHHFDEESLGFSVA